MALDSRNRRGSALAVGLSGRVFPNPDGSINQADRQQLTYAYRSYADAASSILPAGIASAEAIGSAVVTSGGLTIVATAIDSAESVSNPVITTGAVSITATGIASGEAIGAATLTRVYSISPSAIASAEAFGTAVITIGAAQIQAPGIASGELFGYPVITGGDQPQAPAGPNIYLNLPPVHTRTLDYASMVREAWGEEWGKPEVVYEFSNGRKFYSTDRTEHGVYRRS
jgi:hypothetical protein